MQMYKIYIDPNADLEMVWEFLETKGYTVLFSETDDACQYLFASLPLQYEAFLPTDSSEILKIEQSELPAIDWESQWAMHPDYREGFVYVDLQKYGSLSSNPEPSSLKLVSGPGFGDVSHPTTRLVLGMMPPFVSRQHVADIGCGSGILSLAAVAMGALTVCGIDIDPDALIHAQGNSCINGMEDRIDFTDVKSYEGIFSNSVILMNMIQSEQEIAFASFKEKTPYISYAVTSGILLEGRADYLKLCEKWGWKLIQEKEEEGWLGFVFKV